MDYQVMSGHVFAWITGNGWTLIPYTPCRYEQVLGKPNQLVLEYQTPKRLLRGMVELNTAEKTIGWEPEIMTTSLDQVVEIFQGPAEKGWVGYQEPGWHIETASFNCPWPMGFVFTSKGDANLPVFDLVGRDHSLIWIQGPFAEEMRPDPKKMAGPGQNILAISNCEAGPLVVLSYQHEGHSWQQFHIVVERFPGAFVLISGQGWDNMAAELQTAMVKMAEGFQPHK